MTATTTRTEDFATDQTTPLVRMISLIMAVMHIPTLAAGFVGVLFSLYVWPVFPVTLTVFIIGASLYRKYWFMYRDTLTADEAKKIWKRTYIFNLVLLIPAIAANIAIGLTVGWFIVGYIVTSIFLTKIALNEFRSIS